MSLFDFLFGFSLKYTIFLIIKMLYQARKNQISHPMVILSGVLDENLIEMQKNHYIFPIFCVFVSVLFGWTRY